jgi:hypothetical protein
MWDNSEGEKNVCYRLCPMKYCRAADIGKTVKPAEISRHGEKSDE